jgi:hypothetical protein
MKLQTICFAGANVLLCLFTVAAHAQSKSSEEFDDPDFIFSRNHFSFSIIAGKSGRAQVSSVPDRFSVGTSNCFAFGGGINHHYNINKNLSIVLGLHVAAPVRNFEYHVPGNEFNPSLGFDLDELGPTSTEAVFLLRLPLTVEKRWFNKKKGYWQAGIGASLNYSTWNEMESGAAILYPSPGGQRDYYTMLLQTNNNRKPWLNYHFTAGYGRILKNKDILNVGIIVNLSFTDFTKGTYVFHTDTSPDVTGTYKFKGSYAGITAGYVLTGARGRKMKLKAMDK